MPPPHVLREYALLADGERGALVGPRGEIAWLCAPRWDSEAVFSRLIGGEGEYTIAPADPWFVWGGYYEPGSLIWHSRWVTDEGVVDCREALAMPGDTRRLVLLRRVHSDHRIRMRAQLHPAGGFGRQHPTEVRYAGGCWSMRCGPLHLRWSGVPAGRRRGREIVASFELSAGQTRDFRLEISDRRLPASVPDADELWAATEHAWREATPECADTAAPRDARHAYAVLRGLRSNTGGMVAAATMSLPERAEAGRNYDYRYAWIRDQCYAGLAVATHGPHPLLDDTVRFVADRLLADGPRLAPAYRVDGSPVPGERELSGLRGYPGGFDRVGNKVGGQFQLDTFGEALQLFAAAAQRQSLSDDARRAVDVAVAAIARRWSQPDAGVWELEPSWWIQSRLTCVAGLRTAAAAGIAADAGTAGKWLALADRILAETSRLGTHPSGRWQRARDDPRVDAALLLPAARGGLPVDDPRTAATFAAVRDELDQDGYVYRFRHDQRPLGEAEGAFLLCGFVQSLAALQAGDTVAATRWFERNRAACGPPGLFAEEYDVQERQLRGNLPQAFVHALLLECAVRLGQATRKTTPEGGAG
jgi:GH15 family glucan-1,4-alpha-glucosidase